MAFCSPAAIFWKVSSLAEMVASASPLCEDVGNIRRMEDAGAAAVVLHSLFEEQITLESHHLDRYLSHGTETFAESLTYLPDMQRYNLGPDGYLEHLRRAKAAVDIPVIGSLNGVSPGGWTDYAKRIQEAGADALELNVYYIPTDPDMTGAQVEQRYVDLAREVRAAVTIPVALKLGHAFSAMANLARRLDQTSIDGLVLFNRFYQPDFDLEALDVVPSLTLSSSYEVLLRLHWVAILFGQVEIDLAVTGGVHTARDVLKALLAGARVAMTTSALLERGIGYLSVVLHELRRWLEEHEYASVREMRGSMCRGSVANPTAFERANYLKVLRSHALR